MGSRGRDGRKEEDHGGEGRGGKRGGGEAKKGKEKEKTHICPAPHCTSSTMSRLLCTMNWFMCRACSLNRACPSPPCFDVPNSCSKSGLSCVPTMTK